MKKVLILCLIFLLDSCSTAQLVDSWKNPDIDSYIPSKVLVVGLTTSLEAKAKFENKLKEEFQLRGAEAYTSLEVFQPSFKSERLTESEILALEDQLISDGFDTIIFSKVVGSEDKITYTKNFDVYDETFIKFKEDYMRYQDIFYNPDYYEEYTVYYAETSMFCICPTKDRELLWKGSINIVDPQSINRTVKDYITLIIEVLESENLVDPVNFGVQENQ
ncbi:hypothetical protein [Winogradskyella tangerina]|uniref:hypothetical protein n=1 Tax=Winogradskyella tangerina TaxID=2023240 RepID=UPI000DBE98AD|nr:hypothetical protein [Winogradskyella tangerina]